MNTFPPKRYFDVVIVGARCAGASTAMLLARAGLSVLVVDKQSYGSDTLSTHALMRPAVMQLARWGLLEKIIASGAPVIPSTTFHYGSEAIRVDIKADPAVPGLIAPRRTELDRILVDAARESGAVVMHDIVVQDLIENETGRITGVRMRNIEGVSATVSAGIVVGADGLGSIVARRTGAQVIAQAKHDVACIFAYAAGHGVSGYHWHFLPKMSAGAIPTNNDEACIFVGMPKDRFVSEARRDLPASHQRILEEAAPELAARISPSSYSRFKAFRGAAGVLRQAYGAGWILVGDSGFFRDPATAHGITDALRDAEGATSAILAGTDEAFARFQEKRDYFALQMLDVTDAICSFDWTFEELKRHHIRLSEVMKDEAVSLGPVHTPEQVRRGTEARMPKAA